MILYIRKFPSTLYYYIEKFKKRLIGFIGLDVVRSNLTFSTIGEMEKYLVICRNEFMSRLNLSVGWAKNFHFMAGWNIKKATKSVGWWVHVCGWVYLVIFVILAVVREYNRVNITLKTEFLCFYAASKFVQLPGDPHCMNIINPEMTTVTEWNTKTVHTVKLICQSILPLASLPSSDTQQWDWHQPCQKGHWQGSLC